MKAVADDWLVEQIGDHLAPVARFAYWMAGDAARACAVVERTFRLASRRRAEAVLVDMRPWLLKLARREIHRRIWRPSISRKGGSETLLHGIDNETNVALRDAVAELSEDERESLLLQMTGDLTYREVADILQRTEAAVVDCIESALNSLGAAGVLAQDVPES